MSVSFLRIKSRKKSRARKSFDGAAAVQDYMGYPNNLDMGAIIFGRINAAVPTHNKIREIRPLLVTGLWHKEGVLKKIEVSLFTTKINNITPGDYLITSLETMTAFNSNKFSRLVTHTTIILDNTKDNFPYGKENVSLFKINADLWPELLARRAHSLMYNPVVRIFVQGKIDRGLCRTGFVFQDIPGRAILSDHGFTPDHAGTQLQRIYPDGLTPDPDCLAAKVASFVGLNGSSTPLPQIDTLPMPEFPVCYPDWKNPGPPKPHHEVVPSPQLP